jgi:hypothetical protein
MTNQQGEEPITEDYRGYAIALTYDQDADDPLTWAKPAERKVWFALKRTRYTLPFEIDANTDDYHSWRELAEAVTGTDGELAGKAYRFVRWHEHGDITVSLVDVDDLGGWDTGCAGVVFGDSLDLISSTFQESKAYIEGDMYRVTITAPDGNKVLDSLGGFHGYEEAVTYARETIDEDVKVTGTARIRQYGRASAPRAQDLHT